MLSPPQRYTHHDIPEHIPRPDYVSLEGGRLDPDTLPNKPVIWNQVSTNFLSVVTNIFTNVTQAEVAGIRRACRIARSVLDGLKSRIEPGVTTDQLGKVLKRLL